MNNKAAWPFPTESRDPHGCNTTVKQKYLFLGGPMDDEFIETNGSPMIYIPIMEQKYNINDYSETTKFSQVVYHQVRLAVDIRGRYETVYIHEVENPIERLIKGYVGGF